MPYVFTTSYFPFTKGPETAKIYLEGLKSSKNVIKGLAKEIVPNSLKATIDGIEAISVHEVEKGKLEEFFVAQQKIMVMFHKIEGYKYKIDVRLNINEALELIGMKFPDFK